MTQRIRLSAKKIGVFGLLALGLLLVSCAPKAFISESIKTNPPKTVLVLPPENTTSNTEVLEKSYPFVFSYLAERGYYVVSPELALAIFNSNKMNDPGRLNALPPQKFKEIMGVDAVLKTQVTEWSSQYLVVSSSVNVGYSMTLFDATSGDSLWSCTRTLSKAPGNSGGGVIGALIGNAIHAASTSYEPIAAENAKIMMSTLPVGKYGKK